MRSGTAKVCPQCGEIKPLSDFKDNSLVTGIGRFCLTCKAVPTYRKYFTESIVGEHDPDVLSKGDINKLLSFSEQPEKYAAGTSRAKEKVQYLEGIKHKFSEGELATYNTARRKYDTALATKTEERTRYKREYVAVIKEAFNGRRSVKIRYKGSWRTIDPYILNDTYVVSYCHLAHDIRTFRLDRVQGVELLKSFNFNESLQTEAQSRLREASNYSWFRRRY